MKDCATTLNGVLAPCLHSLGLCLYDLLRTTLSNPSLEHRASIKSDTLSTTVFPRPGRGEKFR